MIRIPLRDKAGDIIAHALVDDEDAGLAEHRWCRSDGYAVRFVGLRDGTGRERKVWLHRAVLDLPAGDKREGDHINGDRLDCRRGNLRATTRATNGQNVPSRPGSSSQYRGVSWHKARGKWQATARLHGRLHFLGYFESEDDAAEVARAWRQKHMSHANEIRA